MDPGREVGANVGQGFLGRVGDADGGLRPDAVDVESHAALVVEAGELIHVGEAFADGGNLAKGEDGAFGSRDDGDVGVFRRVVAAIVDAKEDLAGRGFDFSAAAFHGRSFDQAGDVVEREVVASQGGFRDFDDDLGVAGVVDVDLGDARTLEEPVARALDDFAEDALGDVTVDLDVDDVAAVRVEHHIGALRLLGKRGDPVDGLFDVLIDLSAVGSDEHFGANRPGAFRCGGGDFLDAINAADGLFGDEDHATLDLLGTASREGDVDADDVQLEVGKDFLLDLR